MAVVGLIGLAGCAVASSELTGDPLVAYEPWDFSQCVNSQPDDDLFVGAGVLDNSSTKSFRITGVGFVTSDNITISEVVLVPGVEPQGMANSVIPNLKPRWLQQIEGQSVYWPWKRRVPAIGAELQFGETGEVVVRFRQVGPGEWSFSGIKVAYTDGLRAYEHIQPASAASAGSGC